MVCRKFIISSFVQPIWFNDLKDKSLDIKDNQGVIYTGNPKILKKFVQGIWNN